MEDHRGDIIVCSNNEIFFNIVEIKKGSSRGGHFHSYDSDHVLIHGKIEVREKKIKDGSEKISIFYAPSTISVQKEVAHLFTAIDDSMFVESFDQKYDATNYPEYRKIAEESLLT